MRWSWPPRSSRFTDLNYWIDARRASTTRSKSWCRRRAWMKPEDLETLPLEPVNPLVNLMVRDVATVREGIRARRDRPRPSQRYLSITANVEGEDMGRASRQVAQAMTPPETPPRGVRVEPMGQLPPMIEMF